MVGLLIFATWHSYLIAKAIRHDGCIKNEGDVEEMNAITVLGLTETNMAEDNASPAALATKPITRAAEMEAITIHLSQTALEEGCVGSEPTEEENVESLFLQHGPFSEEVHQGQETGAVAEATVAQGKERSRQASQRGQGGLRGNKRGLLYFPAKKERKQQKTRDLARLPFRWQNRT